MNAQEFIKQFHITEEKIASQLKKLESNVVISSKIECPYCKDTINRNMYKSGPWTSVMHCWLCNTISFVMYQDQMSGTDSFAVCNVYGDKTSDKEAYNKLKAEKSETINPFSLRSQKVTGKALNDVTWIQKKGFVILDPSEQEKDNNKNASTENSN